MGPLNRRRDVRGMYLLRDGEKLAAARHRARGLRGGPSLVSSEGDLEVS